MELVQEQFLLNCKDYYTLISIAGAGNMFVTNGGNNLRNDPWISIKTTLNAGRALGFWQNFNIWYQYLSPRFYTEYQLRDFKIKEDWNSNAHALGIGGKVPISVNSDFHHGLNLELGYFWLKGHVYNRPIGTLEWDGFNLNLEYYVGVPSCKYPFELFLGMSIYNLFNKNFIINTGYQEFPKIELGKTHIGLSLGIRYNLLRTPY
jgi:hypothetical protein